MIPVNSNKEYAKNVDLLFLFRFVTYYGKEIVQFAQKNKNAHSYNSPICDYSYFIEWHITVDDSCQL